MEQIQNDIAYIRDRVDHIADELAKRPCALHQKQIEMIEHRMMERSEMSKWLTGTILAVISVLVSFLTTLFVK